MKTIAIVLALLIVSAVSVMATGGQEYENKGKEGKKYWEKCHKEVKKCHSYVKRWCHKYLDFPKPV
jgi:hypothetical protein